MNEELRFMSGVSTMKKYEEYTDIRVDNGDDKLGTGATGEFVHKEGRKGNFTRELFGKEMEVVVVMTKAKISMSKIRGGVRTQEWFSNEFNPLNAFEIIDIRKGDNPKELVGSFTYKQIQERFPKVQGEGGMKNPYNYTTVLYVNSLTHSKILKFVLTGKSMRSWIEFKGQIQDLWSTSIIMKSKEEMRDGMKSYYADFSIGKEVNPNETEMIASIIFDNIPKTKMIEKQEENYIPQNSSYNDIPVIEQGEISMVDEEDEEINEVNKKLNQIKF